ncbi:MAG TPA: hypothetical protein DIU37_01495 [Opitutae bacterium]|nr:hypothetical protein [Opitutae bacterium]|tara:strand:+ start:707 stop:1381 length:675 start_codon:yes stop_codon:yes gene_type:complete
MYYHKTACRVRLKPCDYEFIHATFIRAGESEETLETLFSDQASRDLLLDDARLFQEIIDCPKLLLFSPSLYFYVLVRHVFLDVGLEGRALADYVAAVLEHFLSEEDNPKNLYWVDFCESIERGNPTDCFYKTLDWANAALLMTGVFPDFIAQREQRRGAPSLDFYESAAASCYRMAGGHSMALELNLNEVLAMLSEAFPLARKGLNAMRDRLIFIRQPWPLDLE